MSLGLGLVVLALVAAVAAWFAWRSRGAGSGRSAPAEKRPEDIVAADAKAAVETEAAAEAKAAFETKLAIEAKVAVETPAETATPVVESPAMLERATRPTIAPSAPPVVIAPPAPVETAELRVQQRVLPIVRADLADWSAAIAFDGLPDRLAGLGSLIASALPAGRQSDGEESILAISFDGADAIRVARADVATLDVLARRAAAVTPASDDAPAGWLGRDDAAALAGSVLAGWTRSRYVDGLDAESAEIKSALGAVLQKLDRESQRRLQTLVHELSRFVREARDNYAGALRKPVFLERVAEARAEAAQIWAALRDRMQAIRVQLDALASAPRYGEVQLERTVGQLRALHEERRIEALGARLVAALAVLRLCLDDAADEGRTLDALCTAYRADRAAEQALRSRLAECERAAKGPAYAGKGEFESNRVASRAWQTRLEAEPADGAGRRLDAARAAVAAGFLDGAGAGLTLLLRCDRAGGIEIRRARSDAGA